jgi:hypothetical protein
VAGIRTNAPPSPPGPALQLAPHAATAAKGKLIGACNTAISAGKGKEDFGDVLGLSYLFYESQQSGKLPDWNRVRADKKCGWRRDAHLDEGKNLGQDLVGGYYDAGGAPRGSALAGAGR